MNKQVIISIAREYGSGGHKIAEALAEKYNLTLYDSDILECIATENDIDVSELKKYEEKRKSVLFTRTVAGYSNAPQDIVAELEFDFLRKKASEGESFVVVGRCANSILRDYPGLISIFVTSDMAFKRRLIKKHFPDLTDKAVDRMIISNNRKRKAFHNQHSKEKWGDSRYYELTVSTAKIGVEKACEVVDKYVRSVIE